MVLESTEDIRGKVTFDMMRALGADVKSTAQFYVWPLDKRPTDACGEHGSLPVKSATADGQMLLISSANLTKYAMTLNMELGILAKRGPLPRNVESHFAQPIQQGAFAARPTDLTEA